jgi:hypothetical protein
LLLIAVVCAAAQPAEAKHFRNTYVSFDIPDNWTCDLEETEYVCQPPLDANGKAAMIAILTAKRIGLDDSPEQYMQHVKDAEKQPGVEVVVPPHDELIGEALWLDASLRNSEVLHYTTRYLAREEGNIAVLVTFSAHRSVDDKAKPVSDLIASSVVINAQRAWSSKPSH